MEPKFVSETDLEFQDLVKIGCDNDSGYPQEYDCMHPRPQFQQNSDDLEKLLFAPEQELQKRDVSEVKPPQSVEEFFGGDKRSSSRGTVKLTKRLIETGEVMVEHWNHEGECIATTFISADAVDDKGSPLAKSAITSAMYKTLNALRSKLMPEEITLAEKAIKALDTAAFLEIIHGELYAT